MSIFRIRTILFKDGHSITSRVRIPRPQNTISYLCYKAGYSPVLDVEKIFYEMP